MKNSVRFQSSTGQNVFSQMGNLHSVMRSGAPMPFTKPQVLVKKPEDQYFVVGKNVIGGDEIIGVPKI
jgi:hypothetical protein